MVTASRCGPVEISRADAQRSATWMIGVTLALTVLAVALDKTVGEHIMIEALFTSSFFIALTLSSRKTFLRPYSRTARNVMMIVSVLAWYAFFLAMSALSAMT